FLRPEVVTLLRVAIVGYGVGRAVASVRGIHTSISPRPRFAWARAERGSHAGDGAWNDSAAAIKPHSSGVRDLIPLPDRHSRCEHDARVAGVERAAAARQ